MAIVVKHNGGIAAAAASGFESGKGKRASQTGHLVKRGGGKSRGGRYIKRSKDKKEKEPSVNKARGLGGKASTPMEPVFLNAARKPGFVDSGYSSSSIQNSARQRASKQDERAVDFNNQQWQKYRRAQVAAGNPDPGPSAMSDGGAPSIGGSGSVAQGNGSRRARSQYTDKQREQFNSLSQAYQDAVESGDYTQEELAEIRRQIDAKKMGIRPVEIMEEESPYPEYQGVGDVWEQNGIIVTRKPDGTVSKLGDLPESAQAGRPVPPDDVSGMLEKARMDLIDQGNEAPTPEDIQSHAERSWKESENFKARLKGQPLPFPDDGEEAGAPASAAEEAPTERTRSFLDKLLGRNAEPESSADGNGNKDAEVLAAANAALEKDPNNEKAKKAKAIAEKRMSREVA